MILEEENIALATKVLEAARGRGVTIGSAESCTGGLIAATFTAVAGSSDTFVGGVVSYWVDVKENVLGVPSETVDTHGVVSEDVARAMADGAAVKLKCDFAVSTTGIAGPGGAEPGKPVGTVCFGIHTPEGTHCFTTCSGTSRSEVRAIAVNTVLEKLLALLSEG